MEKLPLGFQSLRSKARFGKDGFLVLFLEKYTVLQEDNRAKKNTTMMEATVCQFGW